MASAAAQPSEQIPYFQPDDYAGIEAELGRPLSAIARRQIAQHVIAYSDVMVGVATIPGSTVLAVGVAYTDENGQQQERPLADDPDSEVARAWHAWQTRKGARVTKRVDDNLVRAENQLRLHYRRWRIPTNSNRPRERRAAHPGRRHGSRRSSPTRAGPGSDDPPSDSDGGDKAALSRPAVHTSDPGRVVP